MSKRISGFNKLQSHIFSPLRDFLSDSRASGILLMACTVFSLLLSNLPFASKGYIIFWQKKIDWPIHFLHLPETNLLFINDVLMTFFFFLVGMEIKRELTIGELASFKKSLLPAFAALGGMIVPAAIFVFINNGTPFLKGWGIPMATDIAFSLGILSLLGNRVPLQLKIFLTALAIIDDLGAVLTIAIFYSSNIHFVYLAFTLIIAIVVIILNKLKVSNLMFYLFFGVLLWYCMFNSGVHATLAGIIMSFCMPLNQLAKIEHKLFHPVNFIIMPLFALANTAIVLPSNISFVFSSTISLGVIIGLTIGKPLGIFCFSYIATKLKITTMLTNTTWMQLLGVALLGGIGFTMSIFTATLAYSAQDLQIIAKVAIIIASILSGVLGYFWLKVYTRNVKLINDNLDALTD